MRRAILVALVLGLTITASGTSAVAGDDDDDDGFRTRQPSMLAGVMRGVKITPLLTVGDQLESGYRFEAIPDGISVWTGRDEEDDDDDRRMGGDDDGDDDEVELFVNHETSKVPFPYVTAGPTADNSENDFDNAQVSRLILDEESAGVLGGSFVISSSEGYQRFCSNYLATEAEGFSRDILFTNEESPDYVFRQETSWPPPIGDPAERESGLVLALDVQTGQHRPIYGMGRHNHENNVAIPGYGKPVVLSGDDTFTSGPITGAPNDFTFPSGITAPAQSQLYSYIAPDTDALLNDGGDLWAFRSTTPGVTSYYDFNPLSPTPQVVTGEFIQVPKMIATGLDTDGSELKAADVPAALGGPYPLPPTSPNWQTDLRTTGATAVGIDGPQWVLEYWGQLNNVFDFVRVEDIAYDKRRGMGNVVYIVDSGRGSTGVSQAGRSTNGRVWKMVLDRTDPTKVTSLTVFVEGDDNPVKTLTEVHQPDNIETTAKGILLTEDPGSSQQFVLADQTLPNATTARLWFVPFSGTPAVVAKVNQSADGGPTDVDGRAAGSWGTWESTGIVDASAAFGRGAFLINIQAHTLWVEQGPGEDNVAPAGPDFTYKREGGQLLLIRLPNLVWR